MTLRDEVRSLLAGQADGGASVLAELPTELVATVLANFADTAPIGEADVLAPLVMQASAVPFDPEIDPGGYSDFGQGEVDSLGELLAMAGVVDRAGDQSTDADPAGLDSRDPAALDDSPSDVSDDGPGDGPGDEVPESDALDFGSGSDAADLVIEPGPVASGEIASDDGLDVAGAGNGVETAFDFDPMDVGRGFDVAGGIEDEVEVDLVAELDGDTGSFDDFAD